MIDEAIKQEKLEIKKINRVYYFVEALIAVIVLVSANYVLTSVTW